MTDLELKPKRGRIGAELVFVLLLAAIAVVGVFYVELVPGLDPAWYGRTRWSLAPLLLLLPIPIIQLGRLIASQWAIKADSFALHSRASLRRFSVPIATVSSISTTHQGRWAYSVVETDDGRRRWLFDRYIRVPDDSTVASILGRRLGVAVRLH